MDSVLRKLKAVLNGLSDKELDEFSLWINNENVVQVIAVDENAISLITDSDKLKYDGNIW